MVGSPRQQSVHPSPQGHGDGWESVLSSQTFEVVVITIVRISEGRRQASGRSLAWAALHVPTVRWADPGWDTQATELQRDDGCVFTREARQAWCPRFSEAASGWGPTGPFNRCLLNQEVNLEAEGSVQGHASGNRAPPRSVWGRGIKACTWYCPDPGCETYNSCLPLSRAVLRASQFCPSSALLRQISCF